MMVAKVLSMADPSDPNFVEVDVRMRGFSRRTTVEAAVAWIDRQVKGLAAEDVPLGSAAGRVLTSGVISNFDVPGFDRAMMDGYAVRAADVEGAGQYQRLPLNVIGQALPGKPFEQHLCAGQAVRIMTGAPLPAGSDCVLPAELAELDVERLLAVGEVSPGKNIGRRGEDIQSGTEVLPAGRALRPQDLGVLSSIGVDPITVVRRPRVNLIVTGTELLPEGTPPRGAQIADANGPMLAALVERDGGVVAVRQIVVDNRDAILDGLRTEADVIVVSGGSSVGQEDHVPLLVAEHGELAVHGVAMRPSSPTGMGLFEGRPVFLLPGNPVSCLCAYDFFAGRVRMTFSPAERFACSAAVRHIGLIGR
jgi:molybdopterin molybdotransferase